MSSSTHGATPYYFVPGPSRHPAMAALGLFFVILGAGQWINGADWGKYSLAAGMVGWLFVLYQWFRDAVAESQKANRAPRNRPVTVAAVDASEITQLVYQIPEIPKPDIEMHVYRLKQGGRPVTPESIRERHEATKKVAA